MQLLQLTSRSSAPLSSCVEGDTKSRWMYFDFYQRIQQLSSFNSCIQPGFAHLTMHRAPWPRGSTTAVGRALYASPLKQIYIYRPESSANVFALS